MSRRRSALPLCTDAGRVGTNDPIRLEGRPCISRARQGRGSRRLAQALYCKAPRHAARRICGGSQGRSGAVVAQFRDALHDGGIVAPNAKFSSAVELFAQVLAQPALDETRLENCVSSIPRVCASNHQIPALRRNVSRHSSSMATMFCATGRRAQHRYTTR